MGCSHPSDELMGFSMGIRGIRGMVTKVFIRYSLCIIVSRYSQKYSRVRGIDKSIHPLTVETLKSIQGLYMCIQGLSIWVHGLCMCVHGLCMCVHGLCMGIHGLSLCIHCRYS